MSSLRKYIEKLSEYLDKACRGALFVALVSMIVVITAQVIFRVFFTALSWTEELSRYLLVWATFLGTAVAFKKGAHIAVTFAVDALSETLHKIVRFCSCCFMAIFFGVTIWYSIYLFNVQVFQVSPAIGIKMRYVYTVIPLSFAVMSVHLVTQMFQLFQKESK